MNLGQENREFSYSELKMPSIAKMRRSNRKKLTIIKEKEEKSNEKEKGRSQIDNLGLFDYEFEKMKEFKVYCPENNVKNIVKKLLLQKQSSPLSAGSKKSRNRWKIGKRVRTSKFLMDSIKEVKEKIGENREIAKK